MRSVTAVLALCLFAVCASCSHGSKRNAQPAPGVSVFTPGSFEELPQYPRSTPLEPTQNSNGVQTRSFKADGTNPEQVVRWYNGHLPGWQPIEAVHAEGVAWAGDWKNDDRTLRVTASPAPTLGGPDTVQYSLNYQSG